MSIMGGLLDMGSLSMDFGSTVTRIKRYDLHMIPPCYGFEVDYENKDFILDRDKQYHSHQTLTSQEFAKLILDDLCDNIRKNIYANHQDYYMNENASTNFVDGHWFLKVDEKGYITVNCDYNPTSNFAYWVLYNMHNKKINR